MCNNRISFPCPSPGTRLPSLEAASLACAETSKHTHGKANVHAHSPRLVNPLKVACHLRGRLNFFLHLNQSILCQRPLRRPREVKTSACGRRAGMAGWAATAINRLGGKRVWGRGWRGRSVSGKRGGRSGGALQERGSERRREARGGTAESGGASRGGRGKRQRRWGGRARFGLLPPPLRRVRAARPRALPACRSLPAPEFSSRGGSGPRPIPSLSIKSDSSPAPAF